MPPKKRGKTGSDGCEKLKVNNWEQKLCKLFCFVAEDHNESSCEFW